VGLRIWLGNDVAMSSGRHVRRLETNRAPQIRVVRTLDDQRPSSGCSKGHRERTASNVSCVARTTAQNAYAFDAAECEARPEETIACPVPRGAIWWRYGEAEAQLLHGRLAAINRLGSVAGFVGIRSDPGSFARRCKILPEKRRKLSGANAHRGQRPQARCNVFKVPPEL